MNSFCHILQCTIDKNLISVPLQEKSEAKMSTKSSTNSIKIDKDEASILLTGMSEDGSFIGDGNEDTDSSRNKIYIIGGRKQNLASRKLTTV